MQRWRWFGSHNALLAALTIFAPTIFAPTIFAPTILALPRAHAADHPSNLFSSNLSSKDFHRKVWPILKAKCLECHHAKDRQGALDLSSRAAMLKGGNSGAALVPGEPQNSLMIELIEFDEMPPRKSKTPRVSKSELELLRRWIASGAAVPDKPNDPPGE